MSVRRFCFCCNFNSASLYLLHQTLAFISFVISLFCEAISTTSHITLKICSRPCSQLGHCNLVFKEIFTSRRRLIQINTKSELLKMMNCMLFQPNCQMSRTNAYSQGRHPMNSSQSKSCRKRKVATATAKRK